MGNRDKPKKEAKKPKKERKVPNEVGVVDEGVGGAIFKEGWDL